jgi:hypothetical protein
MVGEHLLRHAPIGLVSFTLSFHIVQPNAIQGDGKMNSEMRSLYLQPHQLNLTAVGTCVSG